MSARPYTSPFLLPGRAVTVVILVAALLPAATSFAWTPQPVAGDALVRLPGTQPGTVALEGPDRCLNCHLGYDGGTAEPGHWQGSMMAQSARDFLFWATLVVAAQDSIWAAGRPNATDLCLRCHFPEGWLGSRSDPTDGSLMTGSDFDGVHCDACHRLYDPFFETTFAGSREGNDWQGYWDETDASDTPSDTAAQATHDQDALDADAVLLYDGEPFYDAANLPFSPDYTENGGGQMFVSSHAGKRASFADTEARHDVLYSRYHKSRYFCSTCHDVSNPLFVNLPFDGTPPGDGTTVLPSEANAAFSYGHVERTFSEFSLSAFGVQGGAPGDGPWAPSSFDTSLPGDAIARCQDCHLPDVAGKASKQTTVTRPGSTEHPQSGVPEARPDRRQHLGLPRAGERRPRLAQLRRDQRRAAPPGRRGPDPRPHPGPRHRPGRAARRCDSRGADPGPSGGAPRALL